MSRYPFHCAFLSMTLATGLGFNFSIFQQSAQTQTSPIQVSEDVTPPPDTDKPATDPNITRGYCFDIPLIVIKPKQGTPTTLADTPTFLFYIPPLKSDQILSVPEQSPLLGEFIITDQNKTIIYEGKLSLEAQSGLLRISLPKAVAELFVETGNPYSWSFQLTCDTTGDFSGSTMIKGKIQRLSTNREIETKLLQQMTAYDRFKLYQSLGLEYDALILLDELRHQNPNDATLTATWNNLLKANGLERLIGVPWINVEINSRSTQPQHH